MHSSNNYTDEHLYFLHSSTPYSQNFSNLSQQQGGDMMTPEYQTEGMQGSPNSDWVYTPEDRQYMSNSYEQYPTYYSHDLNNPTMEHSFSSDYVLLPDGTFEHWALAVLQQEVANQPLFSQGELYPPTQGSGLSFSGITALDITPSSSTSYASASSSPVDEYESQSSQSSPNGQSPGVVRRAKRAYSKRTDTKGASIQCPHENCTKTFQKQWQLNRHMPYHVKPFFCSHCCKEFGSSKDLKRHTLEAHKELASPEDYVNCPVPGCGVKSTRKDVIKRHIRKMHGDCETASTTPSRGEEEDFERLLAQWTTME